MDIILSGENDSHGINRFANPSVRIELRSATKSEL